MEQLYTVSSEQRRQYASLYVLYELVYSKEVFTVDLRDDSKVLEPLFLWLMQQGYVSLDAQKTYTITIKGHEVLNSFVERYQSFLQECDVYCAVDLEAGDFAFRYMNDFAEQDAWQDFLNQERWDDLRVAVAEHLGLDIIEVIFMGFIDEGAFGRDEQGRWSYEWLLGKVWDDIKDTANTAIPLRALAYEDKGMIVSSKEVIQDILAQGRNVLNSLQ